MTSRLALVVAAGLLLGGAVAPAKAADLGGGCCADLEERVAELEATTAHKGNRVVTLQIYGQVNKALMYWDDGHDQDWNVVDNTLASSRFGFYGQAKINPGWTAGYNMEVEIVNARADEIENPSGVTRNLVDDILKLRKNYWYIESETLGRICVGHQGTASLGASEVVLGNSLRNADPNIGASICIRLKKEGDYVTCQGKLNLATAPGQANYYQRAEDFSADRIDDVIRYDSPSVHGFILSASWGDDDFTDVALRFKREFGSLRIAAAIAYQWDSRASDLEAEILSGSASVMHIPTGIYGAVAAGQRDYENGSFEDPSFWYVQAGIERKLLPFGATTIYGEYGSYDSFFQATHPAQSQVDFNSEATRWGFGVNQRIDPDAMDIYAHATFWSFEDRPTPIGLPNLPYADIVTVVVGTRIRF